MNIFLVDHDFFRSACLLYRHDEIRARKQLLECCQMIATIDHLVYGHSFMKKKNDTPYGTAHKHHPCVTHCLKSKKQYDLLVQVASALSLVIPIHSCAVSFAEWDTDRWARDRYVIDRITDDEGTMVVVRRGMDHVFVDDLFEYSTLSRQYLETTKGFPKTKDTP